MFVIQIMLIRDASYPRCFFYDSLSFIFLFIDLFYLNVWFLLSMFCNKYSLYSIVREAIVLFLLLFVLVIIIPQKTVVNGTFKTPLLKFRYFEPSKKKIPNWPFNVYITLCSFWFILICNINIVSRNWYHREERSSIQTSCLITFNLVIFPILPWILLLRLFYLFIDLHR